MKPVHILLVEDNEGDILLTTEAFEDARLKNTLSVAKDGEQAIKYLERKDEFKDAVPPDLIILDINLPKKNGHEVLNFIKSGKKYKHLPVVMLTTSSSEQDIMKSYQNHANCFITKPVDIDEFMKAVSAIEDFWISIVKLPTQTGKDEKR